MEFTRIDKYLFIKIGRCKGGDERPRGEDTKNMIKLEHILSF